MRSVLSLPLLALVVGCTETPAATRDVPLVDAVDASIDAPDVAVVDEFVEKVDVPPDRVRVVPTDWPHAPPPMPAYSLGQCPALTGGPTSDAGLNPSFATGAQHRQFRLIVPSNYDPNGTDRWPLLFAWHWLGGSSDQMVHEGELELSAERYRFLVVVPDQARVNGDGGVINAFTWPFIPTVNTEPERVFFDDMLACVTGQYRVDPARVHGMGVSAGGLWITDLMSTPRAEHFASIAVLSGGLGQLPSAMLRMQYTPEPNKYPAIVLWGGPTDHFVIDFEDASFRLRDALTDDGHFIVTCTHDRGHMLPPLVAPGPGESKFAFVWNFFSDHPYGLAPATSPWIAAGLPASAPSWCTIPSVFSPTH